MPSANDDSWFNLINFTEAEVKAFREVHDIPEPGDRQFRYTCTLYRVVKDFAEAYKKEKRKADDLEKNADLLNSILGLRRHEKAYPSSDTSSSAPWKTQVVEVHNNATCEGCEKCKKEIWGWIFAFLTVNIIQSIIIACLIWC